mgnify:CR=1 FL=1
MINKDPLTAKLKKAVENELDKQEYFRDSIIWRDDSYRVEYGIGLIRRASSYEVEVGLAIRIQEIESLWEKPYNAVFGSSAKSEQTLALNFHNWSCVSNSQLERFYISSIEEISGTVENIIKTLDLFTEQLTRFINSPSLLLSQLRDQSGSYKLIVSPHVKSLKELVITKLYAPSDLESHRSIVIGTFNSNYAEEPEEFYLNLIETAKRI